VSAKRCFDFLVTLLPLTYSKKKEKKHGAVPASKGEGSVVVSKGLISIKINQKSRNILFFTTAESRLQ